MNIKEMREGIRALREAKAVSGKHSVGDTTIIVSKARNEKPVSAAHHKPLSEAWRKRALKEAFSFLVEADRRTPNQVRVGLAARRAEIERSKGTSSTATLDTVQNRASARKFPGAIVPGLGRTGLSTDQGPDLNQVSGTKNPDLKAELVARRRAYLVASTPKKGKLPK